MVIFRIYRKVDNK